MTNKILVTYASMTGSTKGISEAIGETLTALGADVDVISMKDVKYISQYKAVIAGSAIQAGKWLPEAMDFIQTHKKDLNQKPFAAFLVCMTLEMKRGNQYRDMVSSWLSPVRDIVPPVSEGLFSGILDIKKIPSFGDRIKFRISVMAGVWKEGDHRNWEEIRLWAANLKPYLTSEPDRIEV
jgi:menaquinone-dependent protoporphyrinogen oxidase